jgi:hypothetical protein
MTAPVTATQIVDVDTYCVQVTLDPDQVLTALAEAMRGNNEKLMLIRHLPADHPAHQQAYAELLRILADVFTVTLTPGQAEALGGDLYEATTLPEECVHCENFSVTTVDGIELCHGHARAWDLTKLVTS